MSKQPSKDTELTKVEQFILEKFFSANWVKLQESPQYAYYLIKDDDEAIKISPQELVAIIERYTAEAYQSGYRSGWSTGTKHGMPENMKFKPLKVTGIGDAELLERIKGEQLTNQEGSK